MAMPALTVSKDKIAFKLTTISQHHNPPSRKLCVLWRQQQALEDLQIWRLGVFFPIRQPESTLNCDRPERYFPAYYNVIQIITYL